MLWPLPLAFYEFYASGAAILPFFAMRHARNRPARMRRPAAWI
jgi:hypothetical protein